MSNETRAKHMPTVGRTRYGWFVDFDGFQSAMPDEETARLTAFARNLLEASQTVLARVSHTNIHTTLAEMQETWDLLREAITQIERKDA